MIKSAWLWWLCVALYLSSCAAFQAGTDVQSGRRALLIKDHEAALGYFQKAAETDPQYVYHSQLFREGVWTYLGRAQYLNGRFADARRSLERALKQDRDDNLARLYHGLTLVRSGDQSQGVKQIQSALEGLDLWFQYVTADRYMELFWDPEGKIRTEIINLSELIGGKDYTLEQLIENAEWIGFEMEQEADRARRDEQRWLHRDRGNRPGGLGVGIGF